MTDLAALLVLAIANDRDRINAAAEPFVGRLMFRVDLDCNIVMSHITVSFRPMPEQLTSAPTPWGSIISEAAPGPPRRCHPDASTSRGGAAP